LNELYATLPSTKISNGIIITIKYMAALVSLHRTSQCGLISIATDDHWQDQLCKV
jgi:hypothetical protein